MLKGQKFYIIDTNILVDYVDVIPSPDNPGVALEKPTIDLTGAHLVIPSVVISELSSFKREKSERGKAARTVLKRIRQMVESNPTPTAGQAYRLEAPIEIKEREQLISILPVHKKFKDTSPFSPSKDDMDGQIILAAIAVSFIAEELPIDGTAEASDFLKPRVADVTVLTNDNGLATRARNRGLKTDRYGYKYPDPYTGRRDLVVPKDLLTEFFAMHRIELADWEDYMPEQPKLIANEFIVMRLENEKDYPADYDPRNDPYFSNIGRYDAEEQAIVGLEHVRNFPVYPKNNGQAIYAEALMLPNIAAVVCTGPAGSGKTYMSTIYGYKSCVDERFIGVTVVPCESHSTIGALPGDLDEKMDPDVQPLKNALRNYLISEDKSFRKKFAKLGNKSDSKADPEPFYAPEEKTKKSIKTELAERVELIWGNWFSNIPIENARGRDFACELAIYDEFQDQSAMQADTLIKRIGKDGKIVLTGDIQQIHAPYLDQSNNGLVYASRLLMDNTMVAQVHFTEDEVVRHPLVKEVARRQKDKKF